MTRARDWWRRATAYAKDRRSICLARIRAVKRPWGADLEAAVIRATSHDDRAVDYVSAGRVFSWARASPGFVRPLIWGLARRAARTKSWPVALKSLLIAHGLLFSAGGATVGRLPFDLSDFKDRSSPAFSAFVRAYFQFLDLRSLSLSLNPSNLGDLETMQRLLDLLLQIRPCSDGMEVSLVLETMDCVLIEIFEIYGGICNGIAGFLVGVIGGKGEAGGEGEEERRRRGELGIRVLRRACEQGGKLTGYFEACKELGVSNAKELPAVERIPDEDVEDLERLAIGGIGRRDDREAEEDEEEAKKGSLGTTVVTEKWVLFEEEGYFGNPFVGDLIQLD